MRGASRKDGTVDVSRIISAEIANMSEYDSRHALEDMSYSGWAHTTSVQMCSGGYTWTVTSDYYEHGIVVRRRNLVPYEGHRCADRDVACAQAAVAIRAIIESRGGVGVNYEAVLGMGDRAACL